MMQGTVHCAELQAYDAQYRLLCHVSYSKLMNGLKIAGITIDRKMLSELAISDPAAFTALAEQAKANLK